MNILIIDTDKIHLDVVNEKLKEIMNKSSDDLVVIPKGIDIIQDISVDWMKMIRDTLDEKLKALESDAN